jgi:hypothetical protein
MFEEFIHNFTHNLFKPLLLFFYAGFLIPVFKVKFEFPKVIYQGLTIYLLLAIGWHGGEELASLTAGELKQALGFMAIGAVTNTIIGFIAFYVLKTFTKLRRIDAATVAGYYGSDSAGTFLTAVGVLTAGGIAYAAYMPVMLAIMEIPGCLVALYLISRMRQSGMDALGNMPGEAGYSLARRATPRAIVTAHDEHATHGPTVAVVEEELVGATAGTTQIVRRATKMQYVSEGRPAGGNGHGASGEPHRFISKAEQQEADLALEDVEQDVPAPPAKNARPGINKEMLHEVFFNPGIYLLFAGITIGFISQKQGKSVTGPDDELFVRLFQGMLCLFLLEMGMTASQKLKDLKSGGWQFIAFGIFAPNVFAALGILLAHAYSAFLGQPFETGTYVLFAVLCGAASYIAVPAVQRMAIPEASPTLPLAASLGLTFSYNVTIGIPVYILITKMITSYMPIAASAAVALAP